MGIGYGMEMAKGNDPSEVGDNPAEVKNRMLMDTPKEVEQAIDDLGESLSGDMDAATDISEKFINKVDELYGDEEIPENVQNAIQNILDEYVAAIQEINQIGFKQGKIIKRGNFGNKRYKRLDKTTQELEAKMNEVKIKMTNFLGPKLYPDIPDHKVTPNLVIDEPDFDIEDEELEIEDFVANMENDTPIIDAVPIVPVVKKLSEGLQKLQDDGIAYLDNNQDKLAKMGVTTLDATPGGNTEKGGLQGIVELQSFLIGQEISIGDSGADGIRGTNTQKAVEKYLEKQESERVAAEVSSNAKQLLSQAMMEALPGTGKTFSKESVEGTRKEGGEKYIVKYVIENGAKTDSIWYYPESEQWGVMTPDKQLTRGLSQDEAVKMLREQTTAQKNIEVENSPLSADPVFIESVEKNGHTKGEYVGHLVTDKSGDRFTLYINKDGDILDKDRPFEVKDGIISFKENSDELGHVARKILDLGIGDNDWAKIKDIPREKWRSASTTVDSEVGFFQEGNLYGWMESAKGKAFQKSNAKSLADYVENLT